MSSRKENEGRLIQRVNRYVSVLRKCLVVKLEESPLEVRPFTIHAPDDVLDDLRQRLVEPELPDAYRWTAPRRYARCHLRKYKGMNEHHF